MRSSNTSGVTAARHHEMFGTASRLRKWLGAATLFVMTSDEVLCTAIEGDWGEDRPNLLMHPPCACPRCAPEPEAVADDGSWLQLPGQQQRLRVAPAELGEAGRAVLG